MRVHVVDPSAYTPPYDHALCRALGAAGAEVELFTSRFAYDAVAPAEGYARRELFYRLAHRRRADGPRSRARLALKAAEHVPDMLRYRRAARAADVAHFQWLTVQPLDIHLLPRGGGATGSGRSRLVLTAHDVLPREPRRGQLAAQRRLYERMDAVVVHSEHGRRRLVDELGLARERVHVIRHGVLRPWEGMRGASAAGPARTPGSADASERGDSAGLPPDFRDIEGPVALFLGLLRPYKGLDVLLEAWRATASAGGGGELACAPGAGGRGEGAPRELWIVGMPRIELAPLYAAAREAERAGAGRVRFLPRFVSAAETGAFMRRADLVVLPYREIDQSGVLFTALGAGKPLLLSDAGGFPEVAATGAARTVRAGDVRALAGALVELLGDGAALAAMTARAAEAVAGPYSWEAIGRAHVALYERLLA
ncbi:MAG TPA: glycosyltransferase family 4 protein [Solirubrobacteraceae bacterium]|jgi:glycosyltransferase involved in cell wall biosynthesis|nr:glycosyltransferase family 4 protein [Solirubrobacteraceae bacterium]